MIYFFIFLDITHSAFQKWDKMSFYPYYYSVEFIFSELLCNWRVKHAPELYSGQSCLR